MLSGEEKKNSNYTFWKKFGLNQVRSVLLQFDWAIFRFRENICTTIQKFELRRVLLMLLFRKDTLNW